MKIPLYLRVALVVTALACLYVMWNGDADEQPAAGLRAAPPSPAKKMNSANSATGKTAPQPSPLASAKAQAYVDLFPDQLSQRAIEAAQAESAPPPPPPEPASAPPLPFQLSGVWVEEGRHHFVLNRGDETVIVCRKCGTRSERGIGVGVGDVFFGQYRLEKINRDRLTVTYLPLLLTQTIDIDSAMRATGS